MPSRLETNQNQILITGGAGFIGSHLADSLIAMGKKVIILDNFSTGSLSNVNHFNKNPCLRIVQGSILDAYLIDELVSKSDRVFHLGAAVGVANIIKHPLESFKVNIDGTENVLRACLAYGKRVALTSSSEIYGKNSSGSLSENSDRILGSPEKFRWLYSEAKAIDETFSMIFHQQGLDVRVVRLFNTVGPRQSHKYGMVLPNFVKAAIEGMPIQIHGDGTQTRCFIHVLDVVEALLQVMENESISGEVFNIGNPEETSILQLAKSVISLTNSTSNFEFIDHDSIYPTGFEDMNRRVPDISKARKLLGWTPKINLNQIIKETANHFSSNN
jgi:UDP-glucose 4-epimerase